HVNDVEPCAGGHVKQPPHGWGVDLHLTVKRNTDPECFQRQVGRRVGAARIAGVKAYADVRRRISEHRAQRCRYAVDLVEIIVGEDADVHGYVVSNGGADAATAEHNTSSTSEASLRRASAMIRERIMQASSIPPSLWVRYMMRR